MALAPKEDYKYQKFLNLLNPNGSAIEKTGVALFGLGRAGNLNNIWKQIHAS